MPFFNESFAAPDGTDVAALAGWDDAGLQGVYRLIVISNALSGKDQGGGAGAGAVACEDQGAADHYVQVRFADWRYGGLFAVCRLVNKDNWVGLRVAGLGGAGLRITKCIAGTLTDLATAQPVADATYRLEAVTNGANTDYTLIEVGVGTVITAVVPNSEISGTETRQGLVNTGYFGGGTNYIWDDFAAGPLASGPALSLASFAA